MKNKGLRANRLHPLAGNPNEVAFANLWETYNEEHRQTMRWLLGSNNRMADEISDRDREIAATVVQWLGSPVGFGFVEKALEDCGYVVKRAGKP